MVLYTIPTVNIKQTKNVCVKKKEIEKEGERKIKKIRKEKEKSDIENKIEIVKT